jgi:hypothetical protein
MPCTSRSHDMLTGISVWFDLRGQQLGVTAPGFTMTISPPINIIINSNSGPEE